MMIINLINRLRTPIPTADRILEIVAGVQIITMLVITAIFYKISPDTVPSHFSMTGEPDAYTYKSIYWLTSGMFVLIMLITFISAYYTDKNSVRLPVRAKNMTQRQIMLAARMCRFINIGLGLLWLNILISMASSSLGIEKKAIIIMNVASILILIIPSIWYGIKIMRDKI